MAPFSLGLLFAALLASLGNASNIHGYETKAKAWCGAHDPEPPFPGLSGNSGPLQHAKWNSSLASESSLGRRQAEDLNIRVFVHVLHEGETAQQGYVTVSSSQSLQRM
jgi:hypothetical protein